MAKIVIKAGNTPTPIVLPKDLSVSVAAVVIRNTSDQTVYLSRSQDVTVEDGFPLNPDETITISKVTGDERAPLRGLYGIHSHSSDLEVRLLFL